MNDAVHVNRCHYVGAEPVLQLFDQAVSRLLAFLFHPQQTHEAVNGDIGEHVWQGRVSKGGELCPYLSFVRIRS